MSSQSIDSYRLDKLEEKLDIQFDQIDLLISYIDKLEEKIKNIEIDNKVKSEIKGFFKNLIYYIQSLSPLILLIIVILCSIDVQKLSSFIKNRNPVIVESRIPMISSVNKV